MTNDIRNLYSTQIFEIKETLKPYELKKIDNTSNKDINSILLTKIKEKLGNKCNDIGFVSKDSIEIVSRSIGTINTSHFNGDMYFNVKVRANICIPSEGTKLKCKVIGRNRIGIYAMANPIHIILSSTHHSNNTELFNIFNLIDKDDLLTVEIINYKFKLNSDHIQVIAKLISKNSK